MFINNGAESPAKQIVAANTTINVIIDFMAFILYLSFSFINLSNGRDGARPSHTRRDEPYFARLNLGFVF